MKKRIILSIHPNYANAIFEGHKTFEFRRVLFKENVHEVVVYATSPISKVVGTFRIEEVFQDKPSQLWIKTKDFSGISKKAFDDYFKNKTMAYAIKVSNPVRFLTPQPLSKYLPSNTPPQSFCYI